MGIDVAHVEAGIRSGDMTMPEEINRIVTDSICDYYFTTSKSANNNLLTYNVPVEKIFFVGNTMIDTLLYNLHKIKRPYFLDEYQIKAKEFILLTLHRPSNVDNPDKLKGILEAVMSSAENNKIIFPVHPRTKLILEKLNFSNKNILMIDPQGYLEFIYLVKNTKAIVTDSGGITEEATVLNIPCLTMRNSTERPETVSFGTNELIGDDIGKLKSSLKLIINNQWKTGTIPPLWDGKTSERIVNIVYSLYEMNTKSTAVLN